MSLTAGPNKMPCMQHVQAAELYSACQLRAMRVNMTDTNIVYILQQHENSSSSSKVMSSKET